MKLDFSQEELQRAIDLILSGMCTKIELSKTVKIYKCKNIIRVDIKVDET